MATQPRTARGEGSGRWAAWAGAAWAAWWLIGAVTLARVAYLAWGCPYTLIEDEAHYWEWSRRLAASYYTKGPGVAWLIAASTKVWGDTAFAVRLPAALSSAVTAAALVLLARKVSTDRRVPLVAAACWFLAPAFQVLGLAMTIDAPYLACWSVAAWAAWIGLRERRAWAWVVFGAAIGVGALCKYTILLALPGPLLGAVFALRAMDRRERRGVLLGLAGGVVAFGVCLLPIIVWNQREGWPTVRHLLGHLGMAGGDMPVTQGDSAGWHFNPLWTLSLIGTQVALLGPILALAVMEVWGSWRGRRADPARWAGDWPLVAVSAPILVFYLGVSVIAEPEGNWPLAGFVAVLPLAARRVVTGMQEWTGQYEAWRALPTPRPRAGFFVRRPETPTQVLWTVALAVGLVVALVLPRLDQLRVLPWLGSRVPVHRFMGADRMAAHVERLRVELGAETGREPFVMATHYGRASQLAFYLPGRPVVLCASSLMLEGRRTQYDYWPETNPATAPGLLGRPAVVVGSTLEEWRQVFERVEVVGTLEGDGKRNRPAFKGYGFRGFPPGGLRGAAAR